MAALCGAASGIFECPHALRYVRMQPESGRAVHDVVHCLVQVPVQRHPAEEPAQDLGANVGEPAAASGRGKSVAKLTGRGADVGAPGPIAGPGNRVIRFRDPFGRGRGRAGPGTLL